MIEEVTKNLKNGFLKELTKGIDQKKIKIVKVKVIFEGEEKRKDFFTFVSYLQNQLINKSEIFDDYPNNHN